MEQRNNSGTNQINKTSFIKPMIAGFAVAFILISMMVFSVNTPRPEWGSLWRVQPLIITPLAGASGGLFFYLMNFYGARWGLNKILTVILGLLGFIISLWMGTVLGLHGTLWN
jgi:hypothetical protein